MSTRTVRTMLVAVPVAILCMVGGLGYAAFQGKPGNYVSEKEQYGNAPPWTLTDQNGKTVSSADLAGKVQVVTYLFPYCTSFCPTETHILASLEADLRTAGLATASGSRWWRSTSTPRPPARPRCGRSSSSTGSARVRPQRGPT